MGFLSNISETFSSAMDFIAEKKRKIAKVSKIKHYIKKETDAIIKGYITLGKHYYCELRGVPNKEMQRICSCIDSSRREVRRLKDKLEEVKNECNTRCYCEVLDEDDFCSDANCEPCDSVCSGSTSCASVDDKPDACCSCEPVCNCEDDDVCSDGGCDRIECDNSKD